MILFTDTCYLLNNQSTIFDEEGQFFLSSITINELEGIKSSGTKDESTKFAARQLLHKLKENKDKYKIIPFKNSFLKEIAEFDLPDTADSKIIATAYHFYNNANLEYPIDSKYFCTDDLACETIAASIGLPTMCSKENRDVEAYSGYLETQMSLDEMNQFYCGELIHPHNKYKLLENEYLIIRDMDNKVVDKYKWCEGQYVQVPFLKFDSSMFGKITPFKGDIYQQIAMDSLKNNQVTILGGPAGSGKTYLSLGYLFSELEHGRIDHIVIFCNPTGARNAAKLGFYKGTVIEKLLATQVGHVLISKLGSRDMVESLIDDETLKIIPVVDARGYEVPSHSGVYILEAQNLTADLLRLLLQRTKDDSKIIVDGDRAEQTDMAIYELDNGMRKMSEVFKGQNIFGQVDLVNIYRSKVAALAELMK